MTDIRKRDGAKGVTYQVRFPSASAKTGYAYRTFATLKEARAFREDSSAHRSETRPGSQAVTVAQGVETWLNICEKEGRDGRDPVTRYTLDNYEYRAGIINSYDWASDLRDLRRPDIIAFRSWLLAENSRDVAQKVLSSFNSMMKEMVARGVLSQNVAAGIGVATTSRYDEPIVVPTEKEIRQLLAAADRLANSSNLQIQKAFGRYRPMIYLAVDSGMRPQEYLALGREALRERGIEVSRALDGGGTKISVTKTRAGRRYIDLSEDTLGMVRHYADNQAVKNAHDLVFPTRTGSWQSVRNWRNRGFSALCEEAGLVVAEKLPDGKTVERPKYKPYDLRHFYASMLIDRRVNLKRIQTLMGHRKIQTTLDVYGHLIERNEAEAQERISVLGYIERDSCGDSVASRS